eukprot:SAG22_NODE_1363_length_4612_cov_2.100377_4_plen_497_part_00
MLGLTVTLYADGYEGTTAWTSAPGSPFSFATASVTGDEFSMVVNVGDTVTYGYRATDLAGNTVSCEILATVSDIDECEEASHSCDENARCINTEDVHVGSQSSGSYMCRCNAGYDGDGYAAGGPGCTWLGGNPSGATASFTTLGTRGWEGPEAIGSYYAGTMLEGAVSLDDTGRQLWVVPRGRCLPHRGPRRPGRRRLLPRRRRRRVLPERRGPRVPRRARCHHDRGECRRLMPPPSVKTWLPAAPPPPPQLLCQDIAGTTRLCVCLLSPLANAEPCPPPFVSLALARPGLQDFTLTAGTQLNILVGQQGDNYDSNLAYGEAWGGGGSFVADVTSEVTPLIVAGGGGPSGLHHHGGDASTTTGGTNGHNDNTDTYTGAAGGTGGDGGGVNNGMSGAGWNGDSAVSCNSPSQAGQAWVNGGQGGYCGLNTALGAYGGFSGGGGGHDNYHGGAGGGYSGGGSGTSNHGGGGGGSYNAGTNQNNDIGNTLAGSVTITKL